MRKALPLFLFLLLLSPTVTAQTVIRPPEAFVSQVTDYFGFSSNFQTNINHTWKLSPDDPDQVNGAFDYRIAWNSTDVGLAESGGWLSTVSGYLPVPGRPGWVWSPGGSSWTENTINLTGRNYTIRARDSGLNVSAPSCQLNLSFVHPPQGLYRHSQCGVLDITPPRGAALQIVNVSIEDNRRYTVHSRWQTPLSDPEDGTYDYWAWRSTDIAPTSQEIRDFHSISFLTAPPTLVNISGFDTNAVGEGGSRYGVYEDIPLAPGVSLPYYQAIVAFDTLTHERSDIACITVGRIDVQYSGSACGNITQSGLAGVPTNLTLPFLNAPAIQSTTNLTEAQVGWLYGGMFTIMLAAFGSVIAGPVGAAIAGFAAIPLLFYLGVVPAWTIILSVFGAAAIIFLRRGMASE